MYFVKHITQLATILVIPIMLFLSSCKQQSIPNNKAMGVINQQHISDQQIPNTEQVHTVTKIDQNVLLIDTLQTVYDYEQVYDLFKQNVGMDEFMEAFNITKIKTTQDMTYTVMNSTEGFLFVTFTPFDESLLTDDIMIPENAICREIDIRKILFSEISTQKFFDTVQTGMSVFDVQKADPNGNYDFLSASWSEYPQFSYHFFEDGNAAIIHYKDNLVIKITHFTL